MPRERKRTTYSGAPAQPMREIPPQTYGQGVDQQGLEQAMPTPNNRGAAATAGPPMPAPGSAPQATVGAEPAAPPSIAALLELARGRGADAGLLTAPTSRPNEPVTTGLPIGAGAGPEVVGFPQSSPGGRFLRMLSERTGDPYFADLAERSRA